MASISKSSFAFRSVRSLLQQQQADDVPSRNHRSTTTVSNVGPINEPPSGKRVPERVECDSDDSSWSHHQTPALYGLSTNSGSPESAAEHLFNKFEKDPCSAGKMASEIDRILRLAHEPITESVWEKVIGRMMVPLACTHGSPYIEILVLTSCKLIDHPLFQKVMFQTLVSRVNVLLNPEPEHSTGTRTGETTNLCHLMGSLALCKWPIEYASCAKECNAVLYSVLNLIHSWIRLIEKSSQRRSMPRNPPASCESCVFALVHLCNHCGRKLWLKWPELVDKMYAAIRIAIVAPEIPLKLETKYKLLDLFVQINEWPKRQSEWNKKRESATVATQTQNISYGQDDVSLERSNSLLTSEFSGGLLEQLDCIAAATAGAVINSNQLLID